LGLRRQTPHPGSQDAGRRALIERLYAEHGPALLRYLRRLVGSDGDPADLLHETFLRLWSQPDLASIENVRAWLFRVAGNVARNVHRGADRSRSREQAVGVLSPPVSAVDEQVAVAQRVGRALAAVDERARRALLLFAEGCSYREIADILDLEPGHVGVLLQRARDQFRRGSDDSR
jgi:RNA polymerase sigma factor (sigma-70 family)